VALCGIAGRMNQLKRRDVVDYRYLASTTGLGISISITYIVFLTKLQKGKPDEMDLPLF